MRIRSASAVHQFAVQTLDVFKQTFLRIVYFYKFQTTVTQLLSQRSVANDTTQGRNKSIFITSWNADPATANLVWTFFGDFAQQIYDSANTRRHNRTRISHCLDQR